MVIIGAGPAGLTAAYELSKRGGRAVVLEADEVVGGISRTVERDGWRFDIGGHRFFSKNQEVEDLWTEILGPEMLTRGRLPAGTAPCWELVDEVTETAGHAAPGAATACQSPDL